MRKLAYACTAGTLRELACGWPLLGAVRPVRRSEWLLRRLAGHRRGSEQRQPMVEGGLTSPIAMHSGAVVAADPPGAEAVRT